MKLIFGLGNPGNKYQKTRHNLGQNTLISYCQNILKAPFEPNNRLTSFILKHQDVIYGYSQDFMNLSGLPVSQIANFYKINPQDILIVHDDLDLPVGEYRLQFDRGPAGHNGIISITEKLSTQAFHRLRLGIGHPLDATPVEDFVLKTFTPEENQQITKLISEDIPPVISNWIGK